MNETLPLETSNDRSPVTKALRLLAHVARRKEAVTLADLSRTLGLPKPTTYRLASALEATGFLERDPLSRRYMIGPMLEEIALCALRHGAGHQTRRLLMDQLAQRIGARINLVVMKAGSVTFVEWVESTTPLRVDIDTGVPMPVHCTASGKLLLAFAPIEMRRDVLRAAPFPALTPHSITSARALERELERIRARGWSEDDQELLLGVNCLAVPVSNRAGDVVAGLAAMAPVASLPLAELRRFIPLLREVAGRIANNIAGDGWTGGQRSRTQPRQSGIAADQHRRRNASR